MTSKRVSRFSRYALVVLTILTAAAFPLLQRSLVSSKESQLKNCLYTLRVTIDEYTFDKKRSPRRLEDLIQAGYLREAPIDPMTGSGRTWRATMRASDKSDEPGIWDIHSVSSAKGLDGVPYSDW